MSVCESQSHRRGDPKLSQGYMSGGGAAEKWGSGGENGGKQRRRKRGAGAKRCSARWRRRARTRRSRGMREAAERRNGVHERRSAAPEENHTQRLCDPQCRGHRHALQRKERADGVAVDDDNESGRRRRRWKRRETAALEKGGKGGAMLGPIASKCVHLAESRNERGNGETRTTTFTRGDQRRRRRIARNSSASRSVEGVGVRCRGRRESAESRSTTTMIVDGDGDGGGEDCAGATKCFGDDGEGMAAAAAVVIELAPSSTGWSSCMNASGGFGHYPKGACSTSQYSSDYAIVQKYMSCFFLETGIA
ncbi:hypothetical protein Syun_020394 [Stephania yunnanensis]|uniref:Uncharacterized protein n=1 Tax=Stephania yunnanensis TaxID=152371 RepID=A0AAP0IFI0_9MAGN